MGCTASAIASFPSAATWRAMGSHVVVEVVGPSDLLVQARARLAELEQRWSRFLPDSDVTRLNTTRGLPVFVHGDTRRLVRHAIEAWKRTGGACDASVLDAVVASGYDRSFEALGATVGRDAAVVVPGCDGIVVDDELGSVTLPSGTGFDPGAIGKGLAADLVVEELLAAGADGAFVSIGGDLRMGGRPAKGDGWLVDVVDHERSATVVARLALSGGAVATSTTQRRRWSVEGEPRHHVIDPATGTCADTGLRTATVVAGEAWWAEALATQLLLAPESEWARIVGDGVAVAIDQDGGRHLLGSIDRYLR